MKKVYSIYFCMTKSTDGGLITGSSNVLKASAPDFETQQEAEDYLLKTFDKPHKDFYQNFFILPTYIVDPQSKK